MTIRTRIAGAAVVLLVAATSVLGWAIVAAVDAAVTDRARDEIGSVGVALDAASRAQLKRIDAGKRPLQYAALMSDDVANPAGMSASLTSNSQDVPLPASRPPASLDLPTDLSEWIDSDVHRVRSDDGDRWVAVHEVGHEAILVVAVDTRFGDELVTQVMRVVVAVGSAVVIATAFAAWAFVRRELRPLEVLADAADQIADGDLERRAPPARPSSEVGRVSTSVNGMVDALSAAVAAEEASRVRAERFAADAAHELRTPTTAILGYAQLGADQGPWTDERSRQMWTAVAQQAARLRDLVEQLLEVQRLADGDVALPESVEFDLSTLIASVASDSMVIDPDHPIEVTAPASCWVEAPQTSIQQIVSNLVANVRAHTPGGTRCQLLLVTNERTVEIVVRDEGPGIPPSERAHVFDRFWTWARTRDRRGDGRTAGRSGDGRSIR
jgi:two-component system OmpR family sensor kinase